MKQIIILYSLMLLSIPVFPQVNIGLSVKPGILANRVSSDIESVSVGKDGSRPKMWFGIYVEKELKKHYYFLSGLHWAPKRFGMRINDGSGQRTLNVKLQYVQIPLMLKLLTDEIALDKKIYFQLGPALEIKFHDSTDGNFEDFYIKKINFLDVSLHFETGMEFRVGYNTILAGGIAYYRGLINVVIPESSYQGDLRVKNDFYALNFSIKF
ncbi:MAG: PorT family protein [Cyclobacteriaceae bacterium]|nr:PorT family protein [Cyclobacteriaceae bacterium]